MKRLCALALAILALAAPAMADDELTVYLVASRASESPDAYLEAMALPGELALMGSPARFARKLFSTTISTDAVLPFTLRERVELERSELRILYGYRVLLPSPPTLPRADRRVTVAFSLSELVRKGGDAADRPAWHALRLGVAKAPWTRGQAWVESILYDGAGRFTAVIALKKG